MCDASEIAYCGLFCGECVIREGRLAALSRQLLGRLRTAEFGKLAAGLPTLMPEQFAGLTNYEACCRFLEAAVHLDCEKACKQGGGSQQCPIRLCCRQKDIQGCWTCEGFETCRTLGWLDPVTQGAHLQNIRVIRRQGIDEFLKGPKCW